LNDIKKILCGPLKACLFVLKAYLPEMPEKGQFKKDLKGGLIFGGVVVLAIPLSYLFFSSKPIQLARNYWESKEELVVEPKVKKIKKTPPEEPIPTERVVATVEKTVPARSIYTETVYQPNGIFKRKVQRLKN
ncbi:hypothetical protein OAG42_01825, partial [Akkermansiaceae bacterium]|nr:hypothetical protein [Akkermansiaceae bacterium]